MVIVYVCGRALCGQHVNVIDNVAGPKRVASLRNENLTSRNLPTAKINTG